MHIFLQTYTPAGSYFTAVDLSEFAHELDEAEKVRMAEGGFTSDFYKFVEVSYDGEKQRPLLV